MSLARFIHQSSGWLKQLGCSHPATERERVEPRSPALGFIVSGQVAAPYELCNRCGKRWALPYGDPIETLTGFNDRVGWGLW